MLKPNEQQDLIPQDNHFETHVLWHQIIQCKPYIIEKPRIRTVRVYSINRIRKKKKDKQQRAFLREHQFELRVVPIFR